MAKRRWYTAITAIRHGERGKDGNIIRRDFEPGQVVRGFSPDIMKRLWLSGSIRQHEEEVPEASASSSSREGSNTEK